MTKLSYEDVLNSPAFLDDLSSLNQAITDGLKQAGEPVAINGNVCYAHMQENIHKSDLAPSMGAEDFSYMLEARPGAYIWLGSGPAAADGMLHCARFDFNDEVLALGASYWARLVESELPK